MQKPWHLGKSLEVLLRKKKKKSFAETLKRSPTAARMGREFAGEWIYVYVWLSPFAVHLKLSQHCLLAMLLLLLSCFSRVWLCATPETEAHQAPLSLGFSRQEHWSGLPFPSPMHESENGKWSCSLVSDSQRPHGLQLTRLLCLWDFPGKSTGVGCHCLLLIGYTPIQNEKFKEKDESLFI